MIFAEHVDALIQIIPDIGTGVAGVIAAVAVDHVADFLSVPIG